MSCTPHSSEHIHTQHIHNNTDKPITTQSLFGFASNMPITQLSQPSDYIPTPESGYYFDPQTTKAILMGFKHNMRVLIQGLHGSGKSTHIEQVAARLNWPCVRINLDGNISRLDLVGKDTLTLKDGKQITRFQEGIIPWAIQQPMALIIDEYDAGRPEIMFIIQHLLERDSNGQGKFMLLDKNKVIRTHPQFRLFATANTLGLGDTLNLYHGTHRLNHAQLDRWNIIVNLNYLPAEQEIKILTDKTPELANTIAQQMVAMANLTRNGFKVGDINNLMSPRTLINWAQNYLIMNDLTESFQLSFLNRCDELERPIIAEYFQRVFDLEFD